MNKNVIIIGCGVAGKSLALSIREKENWNLVGFLDDTETKSGMDKPILGSIRELNSTIQKFKISIVIIAIPSQRGKLFREIILSLQDIPEIQLLILPKSTEILQSDVVKVEDLKSLDPEDLVGEEISKEMLSDVKSKASGQNILITGGAGSIGSELTLQLLQAGAKSVTVIDNSERNIFYLHQKMRDLEKKDRLHSPIKIVLGNVQNEQLVEKIIVENEINTIFHASAYKHVYLLEDFPNEALLNNVSTTKLLIELGHKHNVSEFMLISTDKAVKPINIMGKSKRAAELVVQYYDTLYDDMTLSAVRFGNVFNSSGSAIELFLQQISKNEEITITNPKMKRFFMSIPEASSLVLYSWTIMQKNHLYMFEMGDEVKITELAKCLLIINHRNPSKYPFITIGKKNGEKIRELLFDEEFETQENLIKNKINSLIIKPNKLQKESVVSIIELSTTAHNKDVISGTEKGRKIASKTINKIIS
jgi:FlaA1/EpsC-like NDP-sugar epimerase